MEITYHRKGDYFYPNLTLETDETLTIGKYGLLRKSYLKAHKPHWYQSMLMTGKLERHLAEIDHTAQEQVERIVDQLAKSFPPPDKADDPLGWAAHMNGLTAMAEEGHSRIPLIPCQCPASPVFLAAIHGVSRFDPFYRQTAALDHFVCQLNARFPDQRIDIALFKQRRNAGRYKQVEKHLNIIMQIIHGKVKHACQRCPGLLQIQLIVSVDHPASSPRSESA